MATWKRGWRTTLLERRASLATTWAGMSRHQMIDSMWACQAAPATACWMDGGEVAEAGRAGARRRDRGGRRRPGARAVSSGIVGLGEVDEPAVVAEVDRQQLGMAVEAEAGDDDRVELAGQEVGQVERAELLLLEGLVGGRAGVELVAVRALDPLDALALRGRRRASRPSRSRRRRRRSGRRGRAARGPSRPWPRRASAIRSGRMWRRASTPSTRTPGMPGGQRQQLARERAAADDDEPRRAASVRGDGRPQAALARRSSMSRRAVSAATPASRQ